MPRENDVLGELGRRVFGSKAAGPQLDTAALDELVANAKIRTSDGTPDKFSPHNFRRIFATEAVASGLAVRITATILGHDSIATTQI